MGKLHALCPVIFFVFLVATVPAPAQHEQHEHAAGKPEDLGKVNFQTSCEPAVQAQFNTAVAMLHSFWYRKAAEQGDKLAAQMLAESCMTECNSK